MRLHAALLGAIAGCALGYMIWSWNQPYAGFVNAFVIVAVVSYAVASTLGVLVLPRRVIVVHAALLAVIYIWLVR